MFYGKDLQVFLWRDTGPAAKEALKVSGAEF